MRKEKASSLKRTIKLTHFQPHWLRKKESESHSVLSDFLRSYSPWDSPDQNTGVGSLSFVQGIFSTQVSNPGLKHCRWILYQLSHKGSLRILEWGAYPFSSGSFWLRNQTGLSCIAVRFFTNWAMREAQEKRSEYANCQYQK